MSFSITVISSTTRPSLLAINSSTEAMYLAAIKAVNVEFKSLITENCVRSV